VADTSLTRSGWVLRPIPPEPRSIVELIRAGMVDSDLAATIWLLVEGRVPIVVAGAAQGVGKSTLLGALLDFVPDDLRVVELRGLDETFEWLPQASELGWPGVPAAPTGAPVRPETTILLATELSDHTPAYTWGDAARVAVRAAALGYGLAATIHGDSLDDVLATLRANPVRLTDDELSRLGVVLVLRRVSGGRRRVVAAHFLRPVARDVHGHVQRLGPAVLATWDPASDGFEHFGWGVTPELAMRIGRRAGDFELEWAARRTFLAGLVSRGITNVEAARDELRRYRGGAAASPVGPSAIPASATEPSDQGDHHDHRHHTTHPPH
jgi:hypothetical protein